MVERIGMDGRVRESRSDRADIDVDVVRQLACVALDIQLNIDGVRPWLLKGRTDIRQHGAIEVLHRIEDSDLGGLGGAIEAGRYITEAGLAGAIAIEAEAEPVAIVGRE